MGCLSHRRKQTEDFVDQRWEYINLNDFKSRGCGTVSAYIYLWLSLIISVAVYGVDTFTAVQLLIFNRWSSKIDPAVSFDVSKWIFSICIILSFINLFYEGIRARKVIKKGLVAGCYLDNLAVRWESIRMGSGQGWRRFLVFAELTKSKKGAEYIALFTYFNFQSWIRVIICSGPRQVLNALTLKSVYEAKLAVSDNSVEGSFVSFFDKIKTLAEEDFRQALILSGMCFTLVVWIFSALFLLLALCFWLFFLLHWIPRADGGLTGYCERKVTKALMKIVTKKVNKALARQEADRIRAEFKAAKRNGEKPTLGRTATLPNIGLSHDDNLPTMPMMGRNDTQVTLPPYTSRPSTPGAGDQKRPIPNRSGTMASSASYSSRAPLVGATSDFGYERTASPAPMVPGRNMSNYPSRSATSNSNLRSHTPASFVGSDVHSSYQAPFTESPATMHTDTLPPFPPPARSATARTMDTYTHPMVSSNRGPTATPAPKEYKAYNPLGRGTPSPAHEIPPSPEHWAPSQPASRNAPTRSATGVSSYQAPQYSPPRNLTSSVPPQAPPQARNDDFYDWSSSWQSRATPAPRYGTPQGQRQPPQNYDAENQRGYHF